MKSTIFLGVCLGLVSMSAWAEKPQKDATPTASERIYKRERPAKKPGAQASDSEYGQDGRTYRSKKLRIHKHGEQGRGVHPYSDSRMFGNND